MSSTRPKFFRPRGLSLAIALSLYRVSVPVMAAEAFEFNTEVLDLEDKTNIDLNQFSRAGYIMPGTYSFTLKANEEQLGEVSVPFYVPENDPKGSIPCISPELVSQLGLLPKVQKRPHFGMTGNVYWWKACRACKCGVI